MSELFVFWEEPATRAPRSRIVTNGLRIGSVEGVADLRIAAPGVNASHLEVRLRPDGSCELVGMGSSRIVSGNETVSRCEALPGSTVQIGSLTLRFGPAPSPAAPARPAPAKATPEPGRPRVGPAAPARPPTTGRRMGLVVAAASAAAALLAASAVFLLVKRPERPSPAPRKPSSSPAVRGAVAAVPATPPTAKPTTSPDPAADLFAKARKSVVTVIAKLSFEKGFATGTGFFVDAQGRVVTNYHVVKQSDYQQVLLPGSKQPVDARIISKDPETDLVLLQTYVTPPVPVAPMIAFSTELRMGDTVYALGSPAGPELAVSLSRGIVSSDRPRTFGDKSFIQHDAAVNPGNSGGPLLNSRGEVVGLNTAKVKDAEGISFAIPIEDVRRFIEVAR